MRNVFRRDSEGCRGWPRRAARLVHIARAREMGRFSTSKIAEDLNVDRSDKDKMSTRTVGWAIRRLGFEAVRMPNSHKGWRWDDRRVERLKIRYGAPPEETTKTTRTTMTGLKDDLEYLFSIIEDLSREEAALKAAIWEASGSRWRPEQFDELLSILVRDRRVFSPRPGFFKVAL